MISILDVSTLQYHRTRMLYDIFHKHMHTLWLGTIRTQSDNQPLHVHIHTYTVHMLSIQQAMQNSDKSSEYCPHCKQHDSFYTLSNDTQPLFAAPTPVNISRCEGPISTEKDARFESEGVHAFICPRICETATCKW